MRDELLAYLLNDLDEQQRGEIEERLEVDPIWQHELERLRSYLEAEPETTDHESDPLPTDLVSRTCSFVQQASSQGELSPAVLPASLSESQEVSALRSNRWTALDWTVVASILAIMGTLLVPAIRESRESARRLQCEAKLQTIGTALTRYAEQNQGQLPVIKRHENAGMFAVKLLESGVISQEALDEAIVCPSDQVVDDLAQGEVQIHVPTRQELRQATMAKLKALTKLMGGSFAYRIGFFDERGRYRQVQFTGSSSEPVMADKPSYEAAGFQSLHHGTCGQNVLFQDGSVRYVQICIQAGPDKHWFLNEQEEHAAGTNRSDIVMGRSEASPSGTITLIKAKRLPAMR